MESAAAENLRVPQWTFGDKIRKARTLTGLSQVDFAARVNITASTLAAYETDRTTPRMKNLGTLAKSIELLAGIPRSWFFDFEPAPVLRAKDRPSD
ncbi:helix-turn-helix protein [Rathayibacter sp. PhB151]|uniref:helix-turn-helix domain-containing protein n=1 Tax=Rathayibacter sp. PhB151 TaxID=2485189 RepID=UPI00106367CA|nr:helix-turn-helix transcriptional regulator [Rathayibacter sp. PhB151]TDX78685.1 helix-turn-helix protein [Rathayibacter sp. PhB151]